MNDIFLKMQRLAREVQAIRMPLDRLITIAWRGESPDKAAIAHVLRTEAAQKTLELEYETLLFRHITGQFCLITTVLPDNAKDATQLTHRRLINHRESCSFCGLVENSYAPVELVTATNPIGQPIPGERVHPKCSLYWQRLCLIASHVDATPKKSELL